MCLKNHIAGRLVVRQLPRQQPERVEPEGPAQVVRRRHQLVHVDRVQLLAQEDGHEDQATGPGAHRCGVVAAVVVVAIATAVVAIVSLLLLCRTLTGCEGPYKR